MIVGFFLSQNDWMTISDDQMRIVLQWVSRSRGVLLTSYFFFKITPRQKRDWGNLNTKKLIYAVSSAQRWLDSRTRLEVGLRTVNLMTLFGTLLASIRLIWMQQKRRGQLIVFDGLMAMLSIVSPCNHWLYEGQFISYWTDKYSFSFAVHILHPLLDSGTASSYF